LGGGWEKERGGRQDSASRGKKGGKQNVTSWQRERPAILKKRKKRRFFPQETPSTWLFDGKESATVGERGSEQGPNTGGSNGSRKKHATGGKKRGERGPL